MLDALVGPIERLLDKVIPDADQRAKLAHEIATLAQRQAHEIQKLQLKVNEVAAAHRSLFVAGGRPAALWTCVVGLFNNYVAVPYVNLALKIFNVTYTEYLYPDTGEVVTRIALVQMPTLNMATMGPILFGLLGLGAYRSWEKGKGVAREP